MSESAGEQRRTPLYELHRELGARIVPFAGYAMPVQYPSGIIQEHEHTRRAAGLFDVSHMGQLRLHGADAAAALETLVPGDLLSLAPGRMRYTQFTDASGGILDDLMVTRADGHLFLVVNAACKADDIAHLQAGLPAGIAVEPLPDRGLLALQGPQASAVLERLAGPAVSAMPFMSQAGVAVAGIDCLVSRSGYTGEDGYEISVPAGRTEELARRLLAEPEVAPVGLGARDSLRLEAGLCLYGHDIDRGTTPIEAGLVWSISKRRRTEGGFPGDAVVRQQLAEGVSRRRVGLRPEGRAPIREGTVLTDASGTEIGTVTSGGYGPTVGGPIAMGYVRADLAGTGTTVTALLRGKPVPAEIVGLPFVAQRYYRGEERKA
ncbi:MAG: glycine cleavage system aminomethyltransferase GcvT [Alphaproteobacteria bacterium]